MKTGVNIIPPDICAQKNDVAVVIFCLLHTGCKSSSSQIQPRYSASLAAAKKIVKTKSWAHTNCSAVVSWKEMCFYIQCFLGLFILVSANGVVLSVTKEYC